jgi:hypothetical protein
MNRKCWPVVLLLVMLACSFASASVLKSGGYVGPDTQWLQKSDRLMSIYSGQLSFWSNYTLTVPLSVPKEALYKILISASGSPAVDPFGNKWPIMKLKVANREICTWLVEDQRQLFVSTAFKLPQGNHDAQISMINDYNNGREDRNLFVYGLALASVRTEDAQPMVMFGGRPAAVYGEFMEGTKAVVEKRNVDPLYPAKRATPDYTPTTKAPSEIGVRLENGLEYNLADFTVEESLDGQWKISGLTRARSHSLKMWILTRAIGRPTSTIQPGIPSGCLWIGMKNIRKQERAMLPILRVGTEKSLIFPKTRKVSV